MPISFITEKNKKKSRNISGMLTVTSQNLPKAGNHKLQK